MLSSDWSAFSFVDWWSSITTNLVDRGIGMDMHILSIYWRLFVGIFGRTGIKYFLSLKAARAI